MVLPPSCIHAPQVAPETGCGSVNLAPGNDASGAASLHWFAVGTRPQHERRVAGQINRLGIATFVPVERRQRRPSRYAKRKEPREYPLLPRYVLVGVPELPPPWLLIWRNTDASTVVGMHGQPMEIDAGEIERLMRQDAAGTWDRPDHERWMRTRREYQVGDWARVAVGALEGHLVRVEEIEVQTAVVLLRLFGEERLARIRLDKLEAAE